MQNLQPSAKYAILDLPFFEKVSFGLKQYILWLKCRL